MHDISGIEANMASEISVGVSVSHCVVDSPEKDLPLAATSVPFLVSLVF